MYVIDSYPIAVCDNYRIKRSKIYHGEGFRGYSASKKLYFYGLRIHILVTEQGEPVEFFLEPGACSDTRALGCTTLMFLKAHSSLATKLTMITRLKMSCAKLALN